MLDRNDERKPLLNKDNKIIKLDNSSGAFSHVPNDVISYITSYLSLIDMAHFDRTNKRIHNIVETTLTNQDVIITKKMEIKKQRKAHTLKCVRF